MFKCEGCETKYNKKRNPTIGNTVRGETEFRIPTIIRKVKYLNQVQFDKLIFIEDGSKIVSSHKNVGETKGFEIVEEESYCQRHIPKDLKVKVLDGEVERINIMQIKRAYKGEN